MNVLTHCPWCRTKLREKTGEKNVYRACHELKCLVVNENRFHFTAIKTDQGLLVRDVSFILTDHIVKIYFFSGSTQIFPYEIAEFFISPSDGDTKNYSTVMQSVIIPDKTPIILNTALELDFDDIERIEKKIRTYVTFS